MACTMAAASAGAVRTTQRWTTARRGRHASEQAQPQTQLNETDGGRGKQYDQWVAAQSEGEVEEHERCKRA